MKRRNVDGNEKAVEEMVVELMQDLDRPRGYWLVVDASEQSFVDLDDPTYLEFEYVQMMAYVIETAFPDDRPLAAFHLGGGLCTVPRWLAATHPGGQQQIVENSPEIAAMARSLGDLDRVGELVIDDALVRLEALGSGAVDLVVCDIYEGPETVTSGFTHDAIASAHASLRAGGWYVANLSDAAPLSLSRTVAATVREVFGSVVLLAEPAVLRGRRSGNIIVGATDGQIAIEELTRRAASGPLRARVLAEGQLTKFIGTAAPAYDAADLPESGESVGRPFR